MLCELKWYICEYFQGGMSSLHRRGHVALLHLQSVPREFMMAITVLVALLHLQSVPREFMMAITVLVPHPHVHPGWLMMCGVML